MKTEGRSEQNMNACCPFKLLDICVVIFIVIFMFQ